MKTHLEIFPWTDKLATGVPIIDKQHEKLVDLVNGLFTALGGHSGADVLHKAFSDLTDYIAYHFNTEQKFWDQHFGEDVWITSHRSAHGAFVKAIDRLKMGVDLVPAAELTEKLTAYLVNWLVLYILEEDRRMAMAALAIEAGMPIEKAKAHAENEIRTNAPVLIEATLFMYQEFSHRTIALMREQSRGEQLENDNEWMLRAFDKTRDAVCVVDYKLQIQYANAAFAAKVGFEKSKVVGAKLDDLKTGFADEATMESVWSALQAEGQWHGKMVNRAAAGSLEDEWMSISSTKDEEGNVRNYTIVFENLSPLSSRSGAPLDSLCYDPLTKLPNLALMRDRLSVAIAQTARTRKHIAVGIINIDDFRSINKRFDFTVGDMVLVQIANRLKESLRGCDSIGRIGSDEFIIILPNLDNTGKTIALLEQLQRSFSAPISGPLNGANEPAPILRASVGVSMFLGDADTPQALIEHAREAMLEAKKGGGAQYRLHSTAPTARITGS